METARRSFPSYGHLSMRVASFLLSAGLALALCSPAQAQASTIILVRHAEKATSSGDPVLSPAGERRAGDLATALAQVHLDAIFSTQYQRTRFTAEPVARAAKLEPQVIPATGNINVDALATAHAVDALPAGSVVLVVGHSNTLGPIIAALGGPKVSDLCDNEYGTLLIVTRHGTDGPASLIRGHYGAAESADAVSCHQ